MKDLLIIFIVLLMILTLISTFGGSLKIKGSKPHGEKYQNFGSFDGTHYTDLTSSIAPYPPDIVTVADKVVKEPIQTHPVQEETEVVVSYDSYKAPETSPETPTHDHNKDQDHVSQEGHNEEGLLGFSTDDVYASY